MKHHKDRIAIINLLNELNDGTKGVKINVKAYSSPYTLLKRRPKVPTIRLSTTTKKGASK